MSQETLLGKTSDRLYLRLEETDVEPAVIPNYAIRDLRYLREIGLLPASSASVIINTHHEVAIDFLSSPMESDSFLSLKLSDGTPITLEPALQTLDFYLILPGLTQRLRFYYQDGKLCSRRVITAVDKTSEGIYLCDGRIKARPECVFVLREDGPSESVGFDFFQNSLSFLARQSQPVESQVTMVAKKIQRGHFGEERMWDHRRAVNNYNQDLTKSESIIGMGPYLSVSYQELGRIIYKKPELASSIIKLWQGIEAIGLYNIPPDLSMFEERMPDRLELEWRGNQYQPEVENLGF